MQLDDPVYEDDIIETEEDGDVVELTKCKRFLFCPFAYFMRFSLIIFIYIGMLIMLMAVVPVIFNLLLSCLYSGKYYTFQLLFVYTFLTWFPIFSLLLSIIFKLMNSGFDGVLNIFKNATSGFKKFEERFTGKKSNKKIMIIEMVAFILYVVICIVMLFLKYMCKEEWILKLLNIVLFVCFSFSIVFAICGILRVFLLSWVILIFPVKNRISDVNIAEEIQVRNDDENVCIFTFDDFG